MTRRPVGLAVLFVAGSLGATTHAAPPAEIADLVLTGASVVTLDPARPRATAIAVRAGRILRVGSDAEVQALAGPRTRRLALAGRAVVPGLADAHAHVESLGESLEELSLVGATSLEEVLERVRRASAALPRANGCKAGAGIRTTGRRSGSRPPPTLTAPPAIAPCT